MDSTDDSSRPIDDEFSWLDANRFRRIEQARDDLAAIWRCGVAPDLLEMLRDRLVVQFDQLDDLDAAVSNLSRFVLASRSPTALLALFERDQDALPALLQIFATGQPLANRLIADPESFDLMRASDGQPAQRRYLVDELVAEIRGIDSASRAALAIRKFTSRELTRIAYGEFVRGLTPD
ncbi:MAG: glutamate-ammonia-ligase adenylyltransferase, partial [Pirellulaceae bacterium]|nr:glutamate-ammonia-ligase adenylyltransferase [Pirellulaceae bacterium]